MIQLISFLHTVKCIIIYINELTIFNLQLFTIFKSSTIHNPPPFSPGLGTGVGEVKSFFFSYCTYTAVGLYFFFQEISIHGIQKICTVDLETSWKIQQKNFTSMCSYEN